MPFWNRGRAGRADRAARAHGRAPDPAEPFQASMKARHRASRDEVEQHRQAIRSAADAALRRLEARGFPGAVQMADPKRKIRAAWHLCDISARRPYGETGVGSYYLFSTGEVADDGGGSTLAALNPGDIVAALEQLA